MKKKNIHNDKAEFKVPENYFDTFEERLFAKISQEDTDTSLLSDKITSGFKTPDGYFDTLESQLLSKLDSDINDLPLQSNKYKAGFSIPNQYFDNVEETILQKTINDSKKTKLVSLFSRKNMIYVSGIAAMIAIIISVSITKETYTLDFDSIATSDIHEYINEGNVEFSDSEIAALLDDESSFMNSFSDNEISNEELENYLYDEEMADEIMYVE